MKTINHSTGRNYGKPQIIAINVESMLKDEFEFIQCVATFSDDSRGISGRVSFEFFDNCDEQFNNEEIKNCVMSAYDSGKYQTI